MIECMFTFVKCSALFLFIFIFPFHLYEPRSQKNVAQAIPSHTSAAAEHLFANLNFSQSI